MPVWSVSGMKVKCPMGDIIDGDNEFYHFDFATEFIKDEKLKAKLMTELSILKNEYKGRLPFYCNNPEHDILFLYDFDVDNWFKKEHVTDDEMKMLVQVRDAMKKHPFYKDKEVRIFYDLQT